jgi:hypothetical protein
MTSRTSVAFEDNIGTLINCNAVVLVLDDTILNRQVLGADVKSVSVVPGSLAATVSVGLISKS